jgi:hypothetical protein
MPSHTHIPGCARLNVGRLNAFRLNYYEPIPLVIVGGADRTRYVRIEGAQVAHVLNDAPDTGSVRVHGFAPVAGQRFELYQGDRSLQTQLFGGRILETTVLYESLKQNVAYDLQLIDPTWLLNRRRVLARYVGAGATNLIMDILYRFATGTPLDSTVGNPIIDEISFTNETVASCLTAVCERIGAYWSQDYSGVVRVFFATTESAAPITDADARGSRDHQLSEDLSQVVTRIIGRGGSGAVFVDVAPGESKIPITDDAWFSEGGGIVEIGAERLTYTGVIGRSPTGAMVGALTTPTAPLTVTLANGAGLGAGTYQWAQTFTSASGETVPGPVTARAVGGAAPTLMVTPMRSRGSAGPPTGMTPGGRYQWRVALLYSGGGYALGPPTAAYNVDSYPWEIQLGYPAVDATTGLLYYPNLTSNGVAPVAQTQIYRTTNSGSTWYLERLYSGVTYGEGNGWVLTANDWADWAITGQPTYPTGPIAQFNAVTIQAITAAPSGYTGTKLYRTAVNAAQLKLLVTNPGTSFVDTVTDAALGANAPITDTAGVPPSNGQVPAGATVLPVTATQPFTAGGGWAEVGNIPVRYTGVGTGTLTGIPAVGVGSITATTRHGTQVLNIAHLVGVAGQTRPIKAGAPVTLRVEVEDVAAQAALGARLGGAAADGIVEEPFSDARMALPELLNYARALLTDRKDPRRTLRFVTRDDTVQVGRLITVTLTTPPISGTFRVQRIQFSEIAITGGLARVKPLRTVEASTKLYTFADLLRRLRGREGGAS